MRWSLDSVRTFPGPDDLIITEATVQVLQNSKNVATLHPAPNFTRTGQPMTIPKRVPRLLKILYLAGHWEPTTANAATFRIYLNLLINWIWAGRYLRASLIAAWPDPKEEKVVAAQPQHMAPVARINWVGGFQTRPYERHNDD